MVSITSLLYRERERAVGDRKRVSTQSFKHEQSMQEKNRGCSLSSVTSLTNLLHTYQFGHMLQKNKPCMEYSDHTTYIFYTAHQTS